jgi:hypothetical protein
LRSLLQNECKSWAEFYRYVKICKGNRENIPTIRDCNGGHIIDPVEKANKTTIMLLYSATSVTSPKEKHHICVNPSPLKLALLGSG